jgi:hypothetical protein
MPWFAVHGKEPLPTLDASEVQKVKKELITIRDKVNMLLDAIDGKPGVPEVEPPAHLSTQISRAPAESTAKPTG